MKRQFVTEVGIYAIAYKMKKVADLIAFAKRFEHALMSNDAELPSKTLAKIVRKLCAKLDEQFPKTLPLQVDEWRGQVYGGMKSDITVKPTRRDGSFSDSYLVQISLIDVKSDIDLSEEGGEV